MSKTTSYAGELIGETIKIISSTQPTQVGLEVKVVDETKETLRVSLNGTLKTIFKKNIVFTLGSKTIEGTTIRRRPEERLKGK